MRWNGCFKNMYIGVTKWKWFPLLYSWFKPLFILPDGLLLIKGRTKALQFLATAVNTRWNSENKWKGISSEHYPFLFHGARSRLYDRQYPPAQTTYRPKATRNYLQNITLIKPRWNRSSARLRRDCWRH